MLPTSFTDSLLLVKDVVGELLPEPERQTSKKIYSLVQTRDVERPSPRLPMSAATHAAISAQLSLHPPTFSPNKLYDFLPTSQDTQPLLLVKKPAREAGLQHFVISSSTSSKVSKTLTDTWSATRQRLAISSMQDWGLAALQRSVTAAQSLSTDGSAAHLLKTQLASIQDQISFMRKVWVDGMTLDSQAAVQQHCLLRDRTLTGTSNADQYVRRGTERSTSHTSVDRRYSFQREVE